MNLSDCPNAPRPGPSDTQVRRAPVKYLANDIYFGAPTLYLDGVALVAIGSKNVAAFDLLDHASMEERAPFLIGSWSAVLRQVREHLSTAVVRSLPYAEFEALLKAG